MISSNSGDAVALAVDSPPKPIPHYMKHGRDNYIPLDMPTQRVPIAWPYWAATFITLGCVAFVICAYIWRA